jgi:DNA-binding transcriptional MocR family regulator
MSSQLALMSKQDQKHLLQQLTLSYEGLSSAQKSNRLKLDLSRGKPGAEQLNLSNGLEQSLGQDFFSKDGTDTRNYGGIRGIQEARELGAELIGVPWEEIIAGGNSSLSLMHLVLRTAMDLGLWDDQRRWMSCQRPKILTPVPGYDRHFTLAEHFGLEMVNIPMRDDGPDMAEALDLAANDETIKAIWCVPKYANPTGCTYSNAVVQAMAELPKRAKADDFVVLWDNAYSVHDLYSDGESLMSIRDAAIACNSEEHILQFASTSKITHAGSGIAFVAGASNVLTNLEKHMAYFTIGPDKVNQLRHARFLKGKLKDHMVAHAEIIRPKFEVVLRSFEKELGSLEIASWTRPKGGYFVSLNLMPGLAREVVAMAEEVGLTLTPAGATFPKTFDPEDKNMRIAPTFGSIGEISAAMDILTLCIKLASTRKLVKESN